MLHTTLEHPTVVGDDCVIGHLVHLEGCTIEDRCLIGNGADRAAPRRRATRGRSSPPTPSLLNDTEVPPGALAVGAPADIKAGRARPDIDHARASTATSDAGAARFRDGLRRIG